MKKITMKNVIAAWYEGRVFKHPDTGNMVKFWTLPRDERNRLNQMIKKDEPKKPKTKKKDKEEWYMKDYPITKQKRPKVDEPKKPKTKKKDKEEWYMKDNRRKPGRTRDFEQVKKGDRIKMADAVNPITKILWLKGPNKDKFDWMKMDMIKKYLQKDRDILVLAKKIAVSDNAIGELDAWLDKERLYFTPYAKTLFNLFEKYDLKYYLEVVSKRRSSRLSEADALRIWKKMTELVNK